MPSLIGPARPSAPTSSAMLRSVDLAGPAGRLEALLNQGADDAPFAALVCHPHPLGGGDLHNKVVYHAMKVMNGPEWGLGWPVLRFNFRSTGLSQGAHDGQAESQDVLAALDWIENEYNLPLVLAGFSFGAAMAVKALAESGLSGESGKSRVSALITLGLPTEAGGRSFRYPSLARCTTPKLFLSGDRDNFAPARQLEQVAAAAAAPADLVRIPGGDHFFTGRLQAMQEALAGWLKERLA